MTNSSEISKDRGKYFSFLPASFALSQWTRWMHFAATLIACPRRATSIQNCRTHFFLIFWTLRSEGNDWNGVGDESETKSRRRNPNKSFLSFVCSFFSHSPRVRARVSACARVCTRAHVFEFRFSLVRVRFRALGPTLIFCLSSSSLKTLKVVYTGLKSD